MDISKHAKSRSITIIIYIYWGYHCVAKKVVKLSYGSDIHMTVVAIEIYDKHYVPIIEEIKLTLFTE